MLKETRIQYEAQACLKHRYRYFETYRWISWHYRLNDEAVDSSNWDVIVSRCFEPGLGVEHEAIWSHPLGSRCSATTADSN
jgi:hypothetical protein